MVSQHFFFMGILNCVHIVLGACLCGVSVSVLKSFGKSLLFTELLITFLFQAYTHQIILSNLRNIYCQMSNIKLKMNDQDFTFLLQILKQVKRLFSRSWVHFVFFFYHGIAQHLVLYLLFRGTVGSGRGEGQPQAEKKHASLCLLCRLSQPHPSLSLSPLPYSLLNHARWVGLMWQLLLVSSPNSLDLRFKIIF